MNPAASRLATLMGSASFLTLTAITAHAQQVAPAQMAQAAPAAIPEQVLITGSLIHGTAAVGVPVTNLGVQDFTQTGAVTIGDLFRTVPEANVAPGPSAVNSNGHQERETRVNIRGLDQTGPRSLLMVDGARFPPQADGLCAIDPSIIPALALDRVDILADGASATYGSDAIAGVINIVLKRNFDGAVTLLHAQAPTDGGGMQYQASQLFGRTWESGDITLTYEWTDEQPEKPGGHSKFTTNFLPWGLEDPFVPIGSSIPGTITTGAPKVVSSLGTSSKQVPLLVNGTCTNCFAIPRGTGKNFAPGPGGFGPQLPGSAATLTWPIAATSLSNFVDPLSGTGAWELGAQQKNSFVATFDQRLFPGVSFFFSGFYTNRRTEERLPSFGAGGISNYMATVSVPTTNPYYPAGAPAGLRVSYDFAIDVPPSVPSWEVSARYQFGLNLDLPFGWSGQLYDARSFEDVGYIRHRLSTARVNDALSGAQPAGVPWLNVFCDPFAHQCNSPATLAYVGGEEGRFARFTIEEKSARFDGPVFDLPGGQIKAAIGGLYDGDNVIGGNGDNTGIAGSHPPINQVTSLDPEPYHIWAGFAQVDIPVFGDNFNFPLVRRLDLEGSWRIDDYGGNVNLQGTTRNPKLAFTWLVDETAGVTVRGSWGSSFRFANEGEFSNVLSPINQSVNLPGSGQNLSIACGAGNSPPTAGSAAAALFAANPVLFACGSTPGGLGYGGGPQPALRVYTDANGVTQTREGGVALAPEKALNYSVGVEFAPQIDFLRGLDIQATWYSVKINGLLQGFLGAQTSQGFADPTQRFHFILPSDLGCPVAANSNPTTCAPFETMVRTALTDPISPPDFNQPVLAQLSNIYWLNDSGTANSGFLKVQGVDWNASYDLDLGDLGAWNTGITGTYYLHRFIEQVAGGPVVDAFHQNLGPIGGLAEPGVETLPRLIYRARLGWSGGPFSATAFWNHQSHFFETQLASPPNVNFQCTTSGGTLGGGTLPCAISNFSRIQPAVDTMDLSLGYNTGDMPLNDYLKHITLQLTVINLMGVHASFEYGPTSSARSPSGYNWRVSDLGRVIGLSLIKNW
ncbi:MAG: TonB-dependent receptor plug domain-containing protein [Alphaproteobacteria bacterium]|nr:TonB-dependent receptor plug domain-containing protein [Alphaproteobacteria bacterium]